MVDEDRKVKKDSFKEYQRETEPEKRDKGYAWHTAIGLQTVDGLKTSEYLMKTAQRNIEGEISIEQAKELIDSYYEEMPKKPEERMEEADKVSVRIAQILSEKAFVFSPTHYMAIHGRLFEGIFLHAGKFRDYNITKKEWVLDGNTVLYGSVNELKATLEYDFSLEREFSYKGLSMTQIIEHLAYFVSRLWQIHIFAEGNTRATAVFFIKYLRTLGFDVTNDIFAENAWYFRNALVRANYNDLKNGIHETTEYLEMFLRNLLLGETNELHNRTLHISGMFTTMGKQDIEVEEQDIEVEEQDIEVEEQDIGVKKQDIEAYVSFNDRLKTVGLTQKTISNIEKMYEKYGYETVFGRGDIINLLGITKSPASELLKKLVSINFIEPIKGKGKGKYKFSR